MDVITGSKLVRNKSVEVPTCPPRSSCIHYLFTTHFLANMGEAVTFPSIRVGHHDVTRHSRCMYPTCSTLVSFSGRGRPASFCSRQCRKHYQRDRAWLIETIQRLEDEGEDGTSLYARLRWQLRRFPDLSDSDESEATTPASPPPNPGMSRSSDSTLIDPTIWALLADAHTARALAANPHAPVSVLDFLAQSRNPKVRAAVAANPQTATETLTRLSDDPDASVRTVAVGNPSIPRKVRVRALDDRSQRVRTAAAAPPHMDPYEWQLANARRETIASADGATVMSALQTVLTDTLVMALKSDAQEVEEIHQLVGEALHGLTGRQPHALSMAVESEITSRTFTHRLATAHPARTSKPLPRPSNNTATPEDWSDYLLAEVVKCYEIDPDERDHLQSRFAEVLTPVLVDTSGNARRLYSAPRALQMRTNPKS